MFGVIDIHGFKFTWEFIGEFNKNFGISLLFIKEAIESEIESITFVRDGIRYKIEFNYINKRLDIKREMNES